MVWCKTGSRVKPSGRPAGQRGLAAGSRPPVNKAKLETRGTTLPKTCRQQGRGKNGAQGCIDPRVCACAHLNGWLLFRVAARWICHLLTVIILEIRECVGTARHGTARGEAGQTVNMGFIATTPDDKSASPVRAWDADSCVSVARGA